MIDRITSRENPNVKDVIKIVKDKKYRDKYESFIVEGIRLCNEVIENNIGVKKVFYTQRAYEKFEDEIDKLINMSSEKSYCVSEEIMSYMSDTNTPQGIICVCKCIDKFHKIDKIEKYRNIIALENIQNPSNLGTILRTCDAMGADAVVITEETCDVYNPKVVRGSMGSIFHLPIIIIKKSEDALKILNEHGFSTYAMVLDKSASLICDINALDNKKALFIGNEGNGLLASTIENCSGKITIPMKGKSESLNAAVAASIAIWEITGRGT